MLLSSSRGLPDSPPLGIGIHVGALSVSSQILWLCFLRIQTDIEIVFHVRPGYFFTEMYKQITNFTAYNALVSMIDQFNAQ